MLERFYVDNRRRLINTIARKCGGDRVFAEDVIQEAFCKALKFFPSYDPDMGKLSSWFNTIMYNTFYDMRAKELDVMFRPDEGISIGDVITSIPLKSEEFSANIIKMIEDTENSKHRTILRLFFIYGYSSKEISIMMEKTSQSLVTTTVMRFKEGLKDG